MKSEHSFTLGAAIGFIAAGLFAKFTGRAKQTASVLKAEKEMKKVKKEFRRKGRILSFPKVGQA